MRRVLRGRHVVLLQLVAACLAGLAAQAGAAPTGALTAARGPRGAGDEQILRISYRGTAHADLGLMSSGVSRAIGPIAIVSITIIV